MILPIPVASPTRPNAVRFISLKEYPNFFYDLALQFMPMLMRLQLEGRPWVSTASSDADDSPPLPVESVGDFVASFVPTVGDFVRLDPRFVIKSAVWRRLPRYHDYGFVVFQLKAPLRELVQVHPMAFEFRTRLRDKLFFPTLHIHDGKVHARDEFDHQLYWQGRDRNVWPSAMRGLYSNQPPARPEPQPPVRIEGIPQPVPPLPPEPKPVPTPAPAGTPPRSTRDGETPQNTYLKHRREPAIPAVDVQRTQGIYDPKGYLYRWTIHAIHKNEDIIV